MTNRGVCMMPCGCDRDILEAEKIGRATWVCPDCNRDVSMLYYCVMEAIEEEERETERVLAVRAAKDARRRRASDGKPHRG